MEKVNAIEIREVENVEWDTRIQRPLIHSRSRIVLHGISPIDFHGNIFLFRQTEVKWIDELHLLAGAVRWCSDLLLPLPFVPSFHYFCFLQSLCWLFVLERYLILLYEKVWQSIIIYKFNILLYSRDYNSNNRISYSQDILC